MADNINDTDQFLVNRGTSSYNQSAKDLMSTIQDTDLMLIARGGENFKVTCLDVKEQLGNGGKPDIQTPDVVTPPSGSGLTPGPAYYPQSSDITSATNDLEDGSWKWSNNGKRSFNGTYGGGYYWTAMGDGSASGTHKYQYSTDGINWTEQICSGTNGRLRSIAYGMGHLVTGSSSTSGGSTVNVSSNYNDPTAAFWQMSSPSTTKDYSHVAFGDYNGGCFVAVGTSSGRTRYSTNVFDWTDVSMGGDLSTFGGKGLVYGQDKFVAVSQTTDWPIAVSEDGGLTWIARAGGLGKSYQYIAYNGSRFLALATNGDCMYSDDSQYWYAGTKMAPPGSQWAGLTGGDGRFVAVGKNGSMYSDDGGLNWDKWQEYVSTNDFLFCYYADAPTGPKWIAGAIADPYMQYSSTGTGVTTDIANITFQDDGAYNDSGEEQAALNVGFSVGDDVVSIPAGSTGTVVEVVNNTMELENISGDWTTVTNVKSTIEKTPNAPAPDRIVFTSSIPAVDTGAVSVWGNAEWQLSSNSGFSSDVQIVSVPIISPNDIQTVPPKSLTLAYDQQYYVRVSYNSLDPAAYSNYSSNTHTFKTGSKTISFSGSLFYSESTNSSITTDEVIKSYGLDPNTNDMRNVGIYPLTDQPDYPVLAYIKEDEEYQPIPDLSPEVEKLEKRNEMLFQYVADDLLVEAQEAVAKWQAEDAGTKQDHQQSELPHQKMEPTLPINPPDGAEIIFQGDKVFRYDAGNNTWEVLTIQTSKSKTK